jgi:amino acid permease
MKEIFRKTVSIICWSLAAGVVFILFALFANFIGMDEEDIRIFIRRSVGVLIVACIIIPLFVKKKNKPIQQTKKENDRIFSAPFFLAVLILIGLTLLTLKIFTSFRH